MTKKQPHIKPQDVLLLLKLLAHPKKDVRILDLAHELRISSSEVSHGLSRLQESQLVSSDKRSPLKENALEFLMHGMKYIFPAKLDSIKRGIPTAHSAPPLSQKIRASKDDCYIWPYADGELRGQTLIPLYPSVPEAALRDQRLYELLALCDAIRIGRTREQKLAADELKKRILEAIVPE